MKTAQSLYSRETLLFTPLYQVLAWHREGIITDEDFAWYCCKWRRGAPRFSDLLAAHDGCSDDYCRVWEGKVQ